MNWALVGKITLGVVGTVATILSGEIGNNKGKGGKKTETKKD